MYSPACRHSDPLSFVSRASGIVAGCFRETMQGLLLVRSIRSASVPAALAEVLRESAQWCSKV